MKRLYQAVLGIIFLLLAFCKSLLIGKETSISIVVILMMIIVIGMIRFIDKEFHKLHLIYGGILIAEFAFLMKQNMLFLIVGTILLVIASLWNVWSLRIKERRRGVILVTGKVLYVLSVLVVSVCVMLNLYVKPITDSVQIAEDVNVMIDDNKLDSEESMLQDIITMNSYGSRTTGSRGHEQFISWLKQQLSDMGLKLHSDIYTLDQWEEKRSALLINQKEIHVSSAYPYSGETDENGVTGELIYVKRGNYNNVNGKIAVVEINTIKKLPTGLIMNKRDGFPSSSKVISGDGDLVLTSVLRNPNLKKAKEKGAKAVILVWKGVSDSKVEDQYVPFTDEYMGIPAIWVNETDGKKVIEAAKNNEQGTVILEAKKQKKALTESFYVAIEGKNKKESIIINSHTDGVNVVEENGAVGMLSMIRYLLKQNIQPERTMVFAFITGHFRLPEFKGTSQATSTWMNHHPELWDGKNGNIKAVAGITVEHLGSMEWKENESGEYKATGDIQTEYTYTGNEQMESIWKKAIEGRSMIRTVTLRGHNKFEFGESQPLFEARIPVIGLIQMPDYLMVNSESREMDRFNVSLMRQQIESLLKATLIVDKTPSEELGRSDKYSLFYGRTK
ncbi:zinc-binding metallopeptidase family protein [Anaeromicropila herbilytica]|uniref:PA domain-containing protein n=1 Tax=Anaeromicropila herbilytica TaxID=2785025 RepID=A0A7R7ENA5_9FIRM|nr:hypothetical protein [Anaeromicropila herbilytica]BCN31652.1 hypothetical protein bsdtb5_29470 [Anaeromicropila herbilytica]